jgi:hypothetical protein
MARHVQRSTNLVREMLNGTGLIDGHTLKPVPEADARREAEKLANRERLKRFRDRV